MGREEGGGFRMGNTFIPVAAYVKFKNKIKFKIFKKKKKKRVFSNTTVQNHQFFGPQLSSQSNSHIHTWPLGKCKNHNKDFPGSPVIKNLPANTGDTDSIHGLGRFHMPWGS